MEKLTLEERESIVRSNILEAIAKVKGFEPSRKNSLVVTKLEEALLWMDYTENIGASKDVLNVLQEIDNESVQKKNCRCWKNSDGTCKSPNHPVFGHSA